jgi:hypothetical protein
MKNTLYLIAAVSVILIFAGCGAMVGENPFGVTGGGDGGYGSLGTGSCYDGYYGPEVGPSGNWERGTVGSDQGESTAF